MPRRGTNLKGTGNMTEDEFRSGVMADGTRLMQAADPLKELHGRGVALLRHFASMKDMSSLC